MSMTIIGARDEKPKKHNYTQTAKQGKWEVKMSPSTGYGYYEHDVHGEGGGIWIGARKRVEDYDGRGILPMDVVKALRELGYTVPPSCY